MVLTVEIPSHSRRGHRMRSFCRIFSVQLIQRHQIPYDPQDNYCRKKNSKVDCTSPTSPSIRLVFHNVIIPWSPCVPRGIFHYQLTRPAAAALIYVEIWMHEIFRACPCLVQTVSYIIVTRIQGSSMHPSPSSTSSLQALWAEESTPRGPLCSLKQVEDWSK